jgi:hypothetical protein
MSDLPEEKKFLESKFFTFIQPYLLCVDSPRFFTVPFSWLYILFAIIYLISPFAFLLLLIGNGLFDGGGKIIFGGLLSWIATIAAGWVTFQIWWNRRKVIRTEKLDMDVIIDAFSHFLTISCEAVAHYAGIAGFFIGLSAFLFGDQLLGFFPQLAALGGGLFVMIGSLIFGYVGVWVARLIGFLFRKVAEIVVYVVQRIFFFLVHIVKQLFEYFFIFMQSIIDFIVNGWKVVVALVAKLGNTLLAIAHAPVNSNKASITYNRE